MKSVTVAEIFPNTATCKLENIVTGKTRIAHFRHLKPSVGPIVQPIVPANLEKSPLLTQNVTSARNESNKQDLEMVRRSNRIAEKLAKDLQINKGE